MTKEKEFWSTLASRVVADCRERDAVLNDPANKAAREKNETLAMRMERTVREKMPDTLFAAPSNHVWLNVIWSADVFADKDGDECEKLARTMLAQWFTEDEIWLVKHWELTPLSDLQRSLLETDKEIA